MDDALRSLASEVVVTLPRMFKSNGLWVHAVSLPKKLALLARLTAMQITTFYVPKPPARRGAPARIVPVFQQVPGSIPLTFKWTPPADMAVWFINHYNPNATGHWDYYYSSMVWTHAPGAGRAPAAGLFKPPLPNVHENSKLCLGSGRENIQPPNYGTPLDGTFTSALNIFNANRWNADLLNLIDLSITEDMFAFDAVDNVTPIPMTTPWQDRMVNCKVSNLEFNHIPFDQLAKLS